MLEKKKKKS